MGRQREKYFCCATLSILIAVSGCSASKSDDAQTPGDGGSDAGTDGGMACSGGNQGDVCAKTSECCAKSGLACVGGVCQSPTCRHAGDSCANDPCCVGTTCNPNSFCEPPCSNSTVCRAHGSSCAADAECCGGQKCSGGVCGTGALLCAGKNDHCSDAMPCCNTPGAPSQIFCQTVSGSNIAQKICRLGGAQDAHCDDTMPCQFPLACVSGTCQQPSTSYVCNPNRGCSVGDSCHPPDLTTTPPETDSCSVSGLACDANGFCRPPTLGDPCSDKVTCVGTAGSNAKVACVKDGTEGRCAELCTSDADCPDATNFCVSVSGVSQKVCTFGLCYLDVDKKTADAYGISNDRAVLFKPCAGHPDMVCLPEDQQGSTVGTCRQNNLNKGEGGAGAPCKNIPSRTAPHLLCDAANICFGSSCMPICNAVSDQEPSCKNGYSCLIASPSPALTNKDVVGTCSNRCNVYGDATTSGCNTFCGGPTSACSLYFADDPRGAFCVPAPTPGIAVGKACDPFAASGDKCAAGTVCTQGSASANYLCRKMCDPSGVDALGACASGTVCRGLSWCGASAGTACKRLGVCE